MEAAEAAIAASGRARTRRSCSRHRATPRSCPALLAASAEVLGTRAIVGASIHGVIDAGREYEGGPVLAVLAFAGLVAVPFLLRDLQGEEAGAGEQIAARLGGAPRAEDLVIVLPDPRALRPEPLLEGLRGALAGAVVAGAGAMDALLGFAAAVVRPRDRERARSRVWCCADRTPPRIGVTQACRPASELLTRHARAGPLDPRARRPPRARRLSRGGARAAGGGPAPRGRPLLLALPRDARESLAPGTYLVRNLAGFAPSENAFAIPEPLAPGRRIAFVHRDPEAAREDLKAMLAGLAEALPPAASTSTAAPAALASSACRTWRPPTWSRPSLRRPCSASSAPARSARSPAARSC